MNTVRELLDSYKKACKVGSDKAIADKLGVHRQSVSEWRNGKSWPSEEHIVEMADSAGEDACTYLVRIRAERQEGAVARKWLEIARRMTKAAAAVAAVALFFAHNLPTLYIMSNYVRRRLKAGTLPASCTIQ